MDYPGGNGPWYVALLFNTAQSSKKHTHLIAHSMPELAVDSLNIVSEKGNALNDDCWVMMMKVGPFERWADATRYYNEWNHPTRGRLNRLRRGVDLYRLHYQSMGLTMWAQNKNRVEIIEANKQTKPSSTEPLNRRRGRASQADVSARKTELLDRALVGYYKDGMSVGTTIGMLRTINKKGN